MGLGGPCGRPLIHFFAEKDAHAACFQLYQAFDLGEWGRRDDLPEIDPGEPESHSAWYFPKNDLNLTAGTRVYASPPAITSRFH